MIVEWFRRLFVKKDSKKDSGSLSTLIESVKEARPSAAEWRRTRKKLLRRMARESKTGKD